MLLEWAKNKKDEKRIKTQWQVFDYKNGHKEINLDNFIESDYTHLAYIVEGRKRRGFFTKKEVDFISEVLNYHEGRITSMAG